MIKYNFSVGHGRMILSRGLSQDKPRLADIIANKEAVRF